jgi:hypothetical protein
MLIEVIPFQAKFDTTALAGASLWALALYLGFSPVGHWIGERLNQWFNVMERSLFHPNKKLRSTHQGKDSLNALYASVFSVVPFLIAGGLCNYGIELSLGRSWAISMGLLACIGAGVYELGRRDGEASD